ncbi:MAG: sulfatase-like hydrolase/transferase [Proteobacteria bacterium]|nr:sulfatase-like hydrolase/transferase [Pseudomonadota bacterium]MBU4470792.1 sulfatase-like hydrolase/transferase [Pseudomonadota bacterium]MCG2751480.1 sulfatase-like hydrolase/transferase [Desulfobacteraceae bacterium]
MKKIVIISLFVVIGFVIWMNRINLLVTVAGFIEDLKKPISAHQEIQWEQGPSTPELSKDNRPPNIIVILADDLGFNDISYYGGGTIETPHIDTLAKEGIAFNNAYAGNAVCAPSRAMIMTGRYGTRFGFEFTPTPAGMSTFLPALYAKSDHIHPPVVHKVGKKDVPPFDQCGLPASEITIAELLKKADYHTVHIGKWHLGSENNMAPEKQGFDESLFMASGLYLPEDDPDVVNSKQDFDPIDMFLWKRMRYAASFNSGSWFKPKGYLTDYYTDEAIKVIEANKNRPFFLYLAHWGIHSPLQALKSDYDALSNIKDHRLRVYSAMIRALDRSVERVMKALKDNGLDENTMVIFSSDNGGAGYVGLPDINKPYRGWKITLFEGGTHVPFFVRWPKNLPSGTTFSHPVSHMDIFATAAAAAGVALPDDRKIDGVNLLPFIKNEVTGKPHDALFWRSGHYQSVLKDGWKLQVSGRPNKSWLFNLNEDPTEMRNLAETNPDKVKELKEVLAAHNSEQIEPLWPSSGELPVFIDKTSAQPETADDEYIYWPN